MSKKEVTNEDLAIMIANGFAGVDERFKGVDERFENVDRQFEAVDRRFEELEDRMDKGFEQASQDRARIELKLDAVINVTLPNIKKRLTKVEEDVAVLKS